MTRKPNKHVKLIKAWADGADIQFYNQESGEWEFVDVPMWDTHGKYRLFKGTPRAFSKVIKAWADGDDIEELCGCNDQWHPVESPDWDSDYDYRVARKKR